jgi:hypothetical protein
MIFIIDGTGQADPDAYAREMADGFCARLVRKAKGRYWRGPTLSGWETADIARDVKEAVVQWKAGAQEGEKLFLAGHSRGGAAAIFAAQALKAHHVEIDAMFLFDAVDRTVNFRSAQSIPGNVKMCFHAMRDAALAHYYSDAVAAAREKVAQCVGLPAGRRPGAVESLLDSLLAKSPAPGQCAQAIHAARQVTEQDHKMKIVMRSTTIRTAEGLSIDFGNCGTAAEGQCRLRKHHFLGSHGAIGGAPIVDERAPGLLIDADRAAMASVDAWMSAHMCQYGVFAAGRIRE